MSSVIAFCELHGLTRMLNLLRHGGPMTTTQEVFALDVLEELLANDPAKMEALLVLRKAIHPVERAMHFRTVIMAKQDADIQAVKRDIMKLEAIIQSMRAKLHGDDTQIIEVQDAQGYDSEKTQPEEVANYINEPV
jgi:hypothetical protein